VLTYCRIYRAAKIEEGSYPEKENEKQFFGSVKNLIAKGEFYTDCGSVIHLRIHPLKKGSVSSRLS
jgi:hypothetical protein